MKKQINFIVPLGVYPFDVMCSFGQNDKELRKALERHNIEWLPEMAMEQRTGSGRYLLLEGNQSLIWLYNYPTMPEDHGTLAHEIYHCVYQVLKHLGMKPSHNSEEAYAYLTGYLTTEIYKQLNK